MPITERKVTGLHGRTVMLEIENEICIPITDAHNNIRKLINPDTKTIAQVYNYDPFREIASPKDALTNYRFASKHTDPETNLIYFGQRYYDPDQLRWITPDPLGRLINYDPFREIMSTKNGFVSMFEIC